MAGFGFQVVSAAIGFEVLRFLIEHDVAGRGDLVSVGVVLGVIGVQNHVAVVDLYVAIGDENVGFPALLIGLELHHAVAGDHAHLRRLRARGRGAENQQTHGRRVPEKMRRAAHGMYAAQSSWLA